MDLPDRPLTGADLAAALEWWRGAGVDLDFADAAQPWISAPPALDATAEPGATAAAQARPAPPPPPPRDLIGGDRAHWPASLDGFAPWWLAEPTLDHGGAAPRIAPRGPAGAALMVLVEHPEADDADRLLSGRQGALLDAFLRAAGLDSDAVYVAAALPRCTPLPDWAALSADGLREVTLHHVALAAPERLLVLSPNVSSLLGHDPANSPQFSPQLNHEGARVSAMVAPALESMLARPKVKAGMWQRWLDWTGLN